MASMMNGIGRFFLIQIGLKLIDALDIPVERGN